MEGEQFARMVARLEQQSAVAPRRYRAHVAALALLGFAILALLIGAMGFGLVALAGIAVALALSGGGAVLLLVLKLGKVLLLLAIPIWYMAKSAIKALLIRLPAPAGREISRAQAPVLFAEIDRMRTAMNGPRFHHILITDDVNAAIVQRPAFGLVGWPRNYLVLGLPLLECMAPEEALAVVAHEYGHLAGSHGAFSAFIYRLRHTWGTVQIFTDHVEGWLGRLVAPVVRWYVPYFNAYTFVLARAEEYQADAASVALAGRGNAVQALKRVNVTVPRHRSFMTGVFGRIDHQPAPPADLRRQWAAQSLLPPPEGDARRWLVEALDRVGDPMDSHPTLRARLAALSPEDPSVLEPPGPLTGESAAQRWLGGSVEMLRSELQDAWAEGVSKAWAELHEEARQLRVRLDALQAKPERDADEELERLRLTMRLEPDADVRDGLVAFNDAHRDHAIGLYFEGVARLNRGERAGLVLIDRAMEIDPELTKPACERAHLFLVEQADSAAAERYLARWRERDSLEVRRDRELGHVDPEHALASSDLPADQLDAIRSHLAGANLRFLKAVYIARRQIPADASVVRLCMGLRFTLLGRLLGRQRTGLKHVLETEWPVALEVVLLEGKFAPMRKKFGSIPDARLL